MRRLFGLLVLCALTGLSGCDNKPAVQWIAYTPEVMDQALHSGKPVFAYFYAAWCKSCMQLKHETFRDPQVIAALEPFQRIKVDMSFNHSEKIDKIADQFDIGGYPTMIFFNSKGEPKLRHSGFASPGRFLQMIQQFKEQSP